MKNTEKHIPSQQGASNDSKAKVYNRLLMGDSRVLDALEYMSKHSKGRS